MIWLTIKEKEPSVFHKFGFETPYITCIVWVANPDALNGGVVSTCRWDTKNKRWFKDDFIKDPFLFSEPYEITHYSLDYSAPKN